MAGVEDGDPVEKFKANFQLAMTGKEVHGRGEPTTYHLKLQSKPTPFEQNPPWFDVTVNEGEYEGAVHEWALETSQFLDVPGTKVHEVNFIKKVIRMWHERDEDNDEDGQLSPKKKLFVKKPMVIKIDDAIVLVSGEDRLLKLDYTTGYASPVTPAELNVTIKYYGDKVKFSQVNASETYFRFKMKFSQDRIGSQIRVFGNKIYDENLTFTTDIRSTATYIFDIVKSMNKCQAQEDHSSIFAFLLLIGRTKLFEFLDRNQKLGILQTLTQNTGKSFFIALCGLILDGEMPEPIIGFSRYNIRQELSKSGNIWLVDEPTATDPFDELIKSNWSKSHGKIGNAKTECTQSQKSSAIVAVNASIKQLNKDYKLSVPTLSKVEFVHIGENRVEKINPNGFRTDLNACRDAAILLHPHIAPMLAATLFLCDSRVTEEEMKRLSSYCDGDERLTESVALFNRWWNFWVDVAGEYGLELPALLQRPFDPRCFTFYKQQLSELQPKNLDDLIELILAKPEADDIVRRKGKKGLQGFVVKTNILEECSWFEPWMKSQLKSLRIVQEISKGKHDRPKLVTKDSVNVRIWEQLEEFDAYKVSNLCSTERAKRKEEALKYSAKLIEVLMNGTEEPMEDEQMKDAWDTSFDFLDQDEETAKEDNILPSNIKGFEANVAEGSEEIEISLGTDLNSSMTSNSSDEMNKIRGKYVRAPINPVDSDESSDDSDDSTEESGDVTEDSKEATENEDFYKGTKHYEASVENNDASERNQDLSENLVLNPLLSDDMFPPTEANSGTSIEARIERDIFDIIYGNSSENGTGCNGDSRKIDENDAKQDEDHGDVNFGDNGGKGDVITVNSQGQDKLDGRRTRKAKVEANKQIETLVGEAAVNGLLNSSKRKRSSSKGKITVQEKKAGFKCDLPKCSKAIFKDAKAWKKHEVTVRHRTHLKLSA